MESCGRYIVLVMTFEVATHFLKCISCSITPQTPYLMGVADALYHMELATVMEHSQNLDEINALF